LISVIRAASHHGDGVQGDQEVSVVQNVSVAEAVEDAAVEVLRCVSVHLLEERHARTTHSWCLKHQPTVTASKCCQMMVNTRVRHVHNGLYLASKRDVYCFPVQHRVIVYLHIYKNTMTEKGDST